MVTAKSHLKYKNWRKTPSRNLTLLLAKLEKDLHKVLFHYSIDVMVPGAGVEPARPLSRGILSPLCLPISPPGQDIAEDSRFGKWRLSPESNRGPRLCRPLHNHSATQPILYITINQSRQESPIHLVVICNLKSESGENEWSGKRDSNSRPQPWQGCALPTELFPLWPFGLSRGILPLRPRLSSDF